MRKKSHISLSGYLVREMDSYDLKRHKKAFYLGSVLPDLRIRMFREPHRYDRTYEWFCGYVSRIVEDGRSGACGGRTLWLRTGEALHYLADYFTYPHNDSFDGGVREHCLYEGDLKYALHRFVRTPEALYFFKKGREKAGAIQSLPLLFEHIKAVHMRYMTQRPSVAADCRQIVEICATALFVIEGLARQEPAAPEAFSFWRCA